MSFIIDLILYPSLIISATRPEYKSLFTLDKNKLREKHNLLWIYSEIFCCDISCPLKLGCSQLRKKCFASYFRLIYMLIRLVRMMTLEWGILIPSLHSKTKYELLDTFSGKQPTRQTLFVNFTNVFSRGNIHNSQKFFVQST